MIVDKVIEWVTEFFNYVLGKFPEPDPGTFTGVQVDSVLQVLGDINSVLPIWPALVMLQILVLFIIPFLVIRFILFVRYVVLP